MIVINFIESKVTKPYMLRLICDKKNRYTIEIKFTRFSLWQDYYYIGKCDVVEAMNIFREQLQKIKFQKIGVICKQKIE